MKTKIAGIILIVFLFCSKDQKAQSFTTGLSVGASLTSVNFSDINSALTDAIKGKNIVGVEAGIFERWNLGPIFIKPMVLVSYHTGTINIYNSTGTGTLTSNFNYGKTVVPLLFGVRVLEVLRLEAGPVYNWVYASNYTYDNVVKMGASGFGYRVGVNLEFEKINFGLTYQGLTNKSSGVGAATFTSPNELIFSVAFCFGDKI